MNAFLSLYTTNLFLVAGTGLLTTYVALYMGQRGESTFWVGFLTSCYYFGLLMGSRLGYFWIKSVGHIRTFAASTALVLVCVAFHGLSDNLHLWLVLRFIVGMAMMSNYMVLESWLNEQAAPENRGRIFSFYMITSYIGMIAGQFALGLFTTLDYAPMFLVCIAVAIGIIPISTTRRIHPKPLKLISISFTNFLRTAPQSLTAIFFAGIISGSFYGLAPLYASEVGFVKKEIATFMAVTIIAGLLAQWPMGIASDRVRRSLLIRISALIIGVTSLLMAMLPNRYDITLGLTFIFGLFAFTLYPLCSALANSRVTDEMRVGLSAALLFAFGAGASIGTASLAMLMAWFGHTALYATISALTALMFVLLSVINSKQKAEKIESTDYALAGSDITQSPMVASLDPRIDETIAERQTVEAQKKKK
ncbi:MFS transporter [Alteromonas sp. ASW11-36]|uniref:MFS transporter n=1 Tax=Alteromonas arenosi TaxID=3055817 RepID=A0ABT7SS22_9ALTE|nr:MFS transporter [Alteromonas sp. ASW11-36]MDM7858993.1 MFS transporter [Alteromonas sp. ASW11-36]